MRASFGVRVVGCLFGAVVAPFGCSTTAPSVRVTPTIAPTVRALKVGESQQYHLVINSTPTTVTWTTTRPDVCLIDGTGTANALQKGETVITAMWPDDRASLPIRVVPNVDGFWVGQSQFLRELCLSGNCPRSRGSPGLGHYEVTVDQVHDQITVKDSWTLVGETIVLTGVIGLAGVVEASSSLQYEGIGLKMNWSGQLDETKQLIAGHYELIESLGFVRESDYQILSLTRQLKP